MKHRFKNIILTAAAAALALSCLAGCADIEPGQQVTSDMPVVDTAPVRQDYPVSFDNEVFDSAPATAASLSPALTDIFIGLGLKDRLVAVSDYCIAPYDGVKRIGSPAMPDIDAIIELKPELLVSQSPLASADVVRLKQAGIRTLYMPSPTSFEYLCEEYIRLSLIFYGAVDSKDIAVSALSGIDGAMTSAANSDINESFIIIAAKQGSEYAVMGSNTLASSMFGVFGANAFDGAETAFLSEDELEHFEPTAVIADESLDEDDIEELFDSSPRIVMVDLTVFERPTAALAETIGYIMGRLG